MEEAQLTKWTAAMKQGDAGCFSHVALHDAGRIDRVCSAMHAGLLNLYIVSCSMGDGGAQRLASALPRCVALQKITIGDQRITDVGFKAIADALTLCPTIDAIFLYGDMVTDVGAKALADALPCCRALERIFFRGGTQTTDVAAKAFAQALPRCVAVKDFFLAGERLTDDGAVAIAQVLPRCPVLRRVDVLGARITAAGKRHIAQALKAEKRPAPLIPRVPDLHRLAVNVPALPANKKYHVFLGHHWGTAPAYANHRLVVRLADALEALGLHVWIDRQRVSGNILGQITSGVEDSCAYVACVSQLYVQRVKATRQEDKDDWCVYGFNHAVDMLGASHIIAAVTDADALNQEQWVGPVRLFLGSAPCVDATAETKLPVASFAIAQRMAALLQQEA